MTTARPTVTYVVTKFVIGGAQETILRSFTGLGTKFDFTLVTGPDGLSEANLIAEAEAAGVSVRILQSLRRSIFPWFDLVAIGRLRQALAPHPDIVHTHSSKAGVVGRLAAKPKNSFVVHTVHGWSFHSGTPGWLRFLIIRLERYLARRTDILIVVADADRRIGLANGIGRPGQYRLIRSAIDVASFMRSRSNGARVAVRQSLGLDSDAFVVGAVGRLSAQKDPIAFIDTIAALHSTNRKVRGVLVGGGPMRELVCDHIKASGLESVVVMVPPRRDVAEVISAFDAFLITSRWEGLPRVALEAAAVGVPIVTTDTGGIRELVEDGVSGSIVPVGDIEQLASCVRQLNDQPSQRERYVAAAQKAVLPFDVGVMLEELAEVYCEGLSARR